MNYILFSLRTKVEYFPETNKSLALILQKGLIIVGVVDYELLFVEFTRLPL